MTNIKCVIAAGGLGTRLLNFRDNDSTKMLLEVNGIPMINRQIKQLKDWNMEKFVIITNPEFESLTRQVISKEYPDTDIEYAVQETQEGISHALYQAKPYISKKDVTVFVLGDNFFEKNPLDSINFNNKSVQKGSYIFTLEVENPKEFGVAELDNESNVISIEEKPENPKSNQAIVGIYVFDDTVIEKIETLKPSSRGEYEITDLVSLYISENSCKNLTLDGWWIDAGTPERIEDLEKKLI